MLFQTFFPWEKTETGENRKNVLETLFSAIIRNWTRDWSFQASERLHTPYKYHKTTM